MTKLTFMVNCAIGTGRGNRDAAFWGAFVLMRCAHAKHECEAHDHQTRNKAVEN